MKEKKFIIIALDGGAASGKSSTARLLAEKLNLLYVDTGAHYRMITFALLRENIYPANSELIKHKLNQWQLGSRIRGREAQMTINGEVIPYNDLRSPSINQHVSVFSAILEIRHFLLEYQRSQIQFAAKNSFEGLIMEGRDIGSVILPEADFKFFLEADSDTRYSRRLLQGQEDFVSNRDRLDASRSTAPMVCVSGAIRIDSSHRTLDEVVNYILDVVSKKHNSNLD